MARLCETCGLLPGLHRPDGSCPLTGKTLREAQAVARSIHDEECDAMRERVAKQWENE